MSKTLLIHARHRSCLRSGRNFIITHLLSGLVHTFHFAEGSNAEGFSQAILPKDDRNIVHLILHGGDCIGLSTDKRAPMCRALKAQIDP